jgi:hypothetical protein
MSAHIVVVDTAVFARTDANGIAQFDLPAGEHGLKIWHASMKAPLLQSQTLSVAPAGGGQSVLSVSE